MGCCDKKCCRISTFLMGLILLLLGLILALFWGTLYDNILKKELVLTNSSKTYGLWKETPIEMYLRVYLYNWTNSEEVINSKWNIKPKLQECGPYIFSEHHVRVNLTWNKNGTVTYQQKRIWHFVPEASDGDLNDKITNLNPIVALIGHKMKDRNFVLKELVNVALKGFEKELVITKPVGELLFQGFEDEILKIVKQLNVTGIKIPFDKFGWFYMRNNSATYDGTFTMYTGESNVELLGMMDLWNGSPFTRDYGGYCAYVNGTSGELWPPIKNYKRVSIFSSDICSSLAFDYTEDEEFLNIMGKKYVGTDYTFDNGSIYPEQECFKGDKIIPSGLRDISNCQFGAPVFISYPHFYLADQSYVKAVDGLHPNKNIHATNILLEPNTGMPLQVKAQLQINIFIESISHMSMFSNIKPTYMPMLWFAQEANITEKYTSMVSTLIKVKGIGNYVGWSVFAFGIILSFIAVLVTILIQRNDREAEHLLEGEEDPLK